MAVVVACVILYVWPLLATRRQVGASPIPPRFATDLYLYLNLSRLPAPLPAVEENPWYGVTTPSAAVGYQKSPLAFWVFGWLERADGLPTWASMLLWTILWTSLIAASALWLFRVILGDDGGPLVELSVALLLLVDLRTLPLIPSAWLHLATLRGFLGLTLPYVRQFFPQVAIPLLLLYLGLQITGLRTWRLLPWLLMAIIQAMAFAVYPYALLLMAGTSAVALGIELATEPRAVRFRLVAAFVLASAVLDILYAWHAGLFAFGAGPAAGAPHLALLLHLLWSKTLLLVALLTAGVALAGHGGRRYVRSTLVALGVWTGVMLVADSVLPAWLQVSHHALYLVHTTLAIELAWLLAAAYRRGLALRLPMGRVAAAVLVLIILHGALVSLGGYRATLPGNRIAAEQARLLASLNLGRGDLLVAPARSVDDTCEWAPLATAARTLFCRNAEFALTAQQNQTLQPQRLVLYLYFTKVDEEWLSATLSERGPMDSQRFLSLTQSRIALEGPSRPAALASMRGQLIPLLQQVAAGDPGARALLRGYSRVLVLDRADHPSFDRTRLEGYLLIEKEERIGENVLLWCRPL